MAGFFVIFASMKCLIWLLSVILIPLSAIDTLMQSQPDSDGTGTDGADEMLTYHVGSYIASQLVTPPVGTRALYINPNEVILLGINYQNDLFYSADVNATCIDFNNMNRLYNTEKALVTVTLPSDPQGVVYGMIPIYISVQSDTKPQYIAHNNLVIYAQRTIADLNDVGDTEDLLNE